MVKLFAINTGWQTLALFGFDKPKVRVPSPAFLIEHDAGLVLVDSGFHPDCLREPEYRVGWQAKVITFEAAGESVDIAARLTSLGWDPADIRYLVNTHLHADHAGGNAFIPASATHVLHAREWAAACSPRDIVRNFYVPADYAEVRPRLAVETDHDLFGDGAVTLIETPGHTPGHMSVRVTLEGQDVVITGDACYRSEWLDTGESSPIVGYDKAAEAASLLKLRGLREEGAAILVGHDTDVWRSLPEAPRPITHHDVGAAAT